MRDRALSCAEALSLADERHDRRLSEEEGFALRSHLAACRACAEAAAAGDRVHGALLEEGAPALPASFTDEVVARLDRAPGTRSAPEPAGTSPRWARGAVALLGTGAVAAIAVLVLPLEAAADSVGAFLPAAATVPVPEVPAEVASFFAGVPGWLPTWAAALGAVAAAAGAVLQVAASRRIR